jgi:hypothetical protein
MSGNVFLANVIKAIKPPFRDLFLYGSHARGDSQETSDIDVLQVTPTHTPPYSVERVNVTCYTFEQLLRLARRGSLFARHLIEEATPIADPKNVLGALRSAYVHPLDYHEVKREVSGCAPLLDVDEPQFNENAAGMSSLVSYMIRTYFYAIGFDHGARSFSMAHILGLLGRKEASITLSNVRERRSFSAFVAARTLFEELTRTTCRRMEGSLEAFIVNASAHNELAVILGLRLLARGRPFTYDALQDAEF